MTKEEYQEKIRKRRQITITRDTVLVGAGLALTVYEAIIRTGPTRPEFLVLYGGMMGLGGVLRGIEWRKTNGNGNGANDNGSKE